MLYIGWGEEKAIVLIVFLFLFPLFATEHYLCKSKSAKYFLGLVPILLFHLLAGFNLFNGIETKTVITLLVLNSIILSIPWALYIYIKETNNLLVSLLFLLATWLTLEYFNAHADIFTPWFNLGNSLAGSVELIQWYEYTGVSGGTLWIMLTNIISFYSFYLFLNRKYGFFIFGIILVCTSFFLPQLISSKIKFADSGKQIGVVVLDINNNWDSAVMRVTFDEMLLASKTFVSDQTTYIVWPEGAFGNEIREDQIDQSYFVEKIRQVLASDKTSLISGLTINNGEKHYNSAVIVKLNDNYLYIKQKLVPFAEFNPLLFFNGLKILDTEELEFTTRDNIEKTPESLSIGICYDALFGEIISLNCVKSRGGIIAILSNEQWTIGASESLLQIASLRAIENRKYVLRSTNNGISSMITPYGVVKRMPESKYRIAVFNFNVIQNNYVTFYMRHGDLIGEISIILSSILSILFFLKIIGFFRFLKSMILMRDGKN